MRLAIIVLLFEREKSSSEEGENEIEIHLLNSMGSVQRYESGSVCAISKMSSFQVGR